MSLIRAAVLTNLEEVSRFVGVDPAPLLQNEGIDLALLVDPDQLIPLDRVNRVIKGVARESACEHFGILLAESRSLGSVGPISLLLAHEPSVGDILDAVVRYQQILGDAVLFRSEAADDAQLIGIQLSGSGDHRQLTEFTVALFCRCISTILDRPWMPESIHFPHSAPKDMRVHARVFTCPIDFDSDFVGIVCPQSALQQRNPAGDTELVAHAEHFLALVAPPRSDSAGERVRRALRLLLPEQRGTIEDVARHMGTGARTLQRQLNREGQAFAALLNQIRREHALRHLSQAHPLSMVAQMVGYRGVSSFTRWFNAEFGMPPAAWRRQRSDDEA